MFISIVQIGLFQILLQMNFYSAMCKVHFYHVSALQTLKCIHPCVKRLMLCMNFGYTSPTAVILHVNIVSSLLLRAKKKPLRLGHIIPFIDEAYALGARLFVLSGGEPLVHPEILPLLEHLFALKGTEVVILTNGILVEKIFTCKAFPKERLHFQISLDGLSDEHDALRGKGNFATLEERLKWLKSEGYAFSLSLCLHPFNIQSLDALLDEVKRLGASHLHFLWYFL